MNHCHTIALFLILTTCMSCVFGLDFTGANWIWAGQPVGGSYPEGNVTFRRDFIATNGKVPIYANILITTDDAYKLYVNGKLVDSGDTSTSAQRYCVPLVNSCNVFAVVGQNALQSAAGLLAAIQIRYNNGFVDNIVSDGEWHAVSGTPAGFEQCAFDDSLWPAAFVVGPYSALASYIKIPPASQNPGPPLQYAEWIWTHELVGPGSSVSAGSRAFRKTVLVPNGGVVVQAKILIAADDAFTIYVNGLLVGSGITSEDVANRYVVNFPPTSRVTIAIYATNTESASTAGVAAAFDLVNCNCSEDVPFVTDVSWKYSMETPPGFIYPDFDDSEWLFAVSQGRVAARPVTAPAANSPQSPAALGAPDAPPAVVVA